MDADFLIACGNDCREQNKPHEALQYYAKVFIQEPENFSAWNNYGNVLRELGLPQRAIPFLQHALVLNPTSPTANFNLAVSYLLMGNYQQGWPAYEARWTYEHLAGTLPQFNCLRWTGEDLNGKTILVVGEQGHGDNIQFARFLFNLHERGAKILFQTTDGLIPVFQPSNLLSWVGRYSDTPPDFDYWVPIMSIPGILGVTLDNLPQILSYLGADQHSAKQWLNILGPKNKMRVGFCWSGRRDTWLNRHKGLPFESILSLIKSNPEYEWVNLQIDATDEESQQLAEAGVKLFPGSIVSFVETAALLSHMDVVIGVDSAVSHLSGALGRPTWIMLNNFAVDWRWLLNRNDSPWYMSAKLFRQPNFGDWDSVIKQISLHLKYFKV